MTDRVELLEEDHVYARRVIAAFFGDAFSASYTTVNHDVIEVLGHMIAESSDCSEWIELVPSPVAPVGARPGLEWSLRQVRKVGRGLMASAISEMYCPFLGKMGNIGSAIPLLFRQSEARPCTA